jgi:hypothetical protein
MTRIGKPQATQLDPVEVWERLLQDVAEQHAEDFVPTESDLKWAKDTRAYVNRRLAELRRRLTPTASPPREGVVVPAWVQALDRAALLAQIEALRQGEAARYAHHDLTALTDDDLRALLALLTEPAER